MQLRFAVRDTGIGIAEDQFDSVFDAFTQVDASSTRRHGGSGLGLAIVKELAELMGGRVGVDSQLDQGSTFWFELRLKTRRPSRRRRRRLRHGEQSRSSIVPPAHILLAEDDAVNQMVVAAMLEKMGCVVDVVDDGEAACGAVAQTRYDLVFMDCHMPVMDGFEATRRIRETARGDDTHTPIVALTADRACRRPRALPRLGDGRLHDQAGSHGAARGGGATLGRRQARPLTLRDPGRSRHAERRCVTATPSMPTKDSPRRRAGKPAYSGKRPSPNMRLQHRPGRAQRPNQRL